MGLIWTMLGLQATGRNDDPDSTTGLTSRDKCNIRTSWKLVMKNPTENGVALLMLYFKKHPEAKQVFPFKDISDADLPQNIKFRTHCNGVIYSVASMVDALDDVNLLVSILEKLATTHARRHVTEELFLKLKETIIELFSSLFTKDQLTSWGKALDVIFAVINKTNEKTSNT